MNILKAKEVKIQIDKHYVGGQGSYVDILNHLKNNRIDHGVKVAHNHSGFDTSGNDVLPAIIHYDDNSVLILSGYSTEAAMII